MGHFCSVHPLQLRVGERPLDTLAQSLLSNQGASRWSRRALNARSPHAYPARVKRHHLTPAIWFIIATAKWGMVPTAAETRRPARVDLAPSHRQTALRTAARPPCTPAGSGPRIADGNVHFLRGNSVDVDADEWHSYSFLISVTRKPV